MRDPPDVASLVQLTAACRPERHCGKTQRPRAGHMPCSMLLPRSRPTETWCWAYALAAAVCDGYALRYASAELRDDREVVLAAVARSSRLALPHACREIRADRGVVLAAVRRLSLCG